MAWSSVKKSTDNFTFNLKEMGMRMRIKFSWFRIGTSGGHL
jgi:hypothetical protein